MQHLMGFKARKSTYRIGIAPTGRARCRGCKRLIAMGETRIVITAFVLPGRATVFSRCGRCLGTRFATAVLDVYGTADRVPREPGLTDREAARVCARLSDAARGACSAADTAQLRASRAKTLA